MTISLDHIRNMLEQKSKKLERLAKTIDEHDGETLQEGDKKLVRSVIADMWEEDFTFQLFDYIRTGREIELPKLEIHL